MFAGYAGWGRGQLDAELADGDWIAHPAEPQDVFTDVPEGLWSSVLTRRAAATRDRSHAAGPQRQLSGPATLL